ncbi:MAG: PDZ domain-containing protein [Gemmatimonadales bacterium]
MEEHDATSDAAGVIESRLGIGVSSLDQEAARELGLPRDVRGVLVQSVDPFGPANDLLFADAGNVITEVEGRAVRSETDLANALGAQAQVRSSR